MRRSTIVVVTLILTIAVFSSLVVYREMESYSEGSDDNDSAVGFVYKPFDATPFIDQDELSEAGNLLNQISTFIDQLSRILDIAGGCAKLAAPDSSTIRAVANQLVAFYPHNREYQAKEIYYWVANWISYDYAATEEFLSGTQREVPVQTIYDRTGVCLNYVVVLTSLYEAAGFDAKIVAVWNGDWFWERSDEHALVLLYYPNLDYAYYFEDGWMVLDPTAGSTAGWDFGEYYPHGYDHHDIADV